MKTRKPIKMQKQRIEGNDMTTFTDSINKNVLHPISGAKVKRTANISLPQAADLNEALAMSGNDESALVKWYNHGRRLHARTVAANSLLGASDKDMRKLIKQYQETLSMLVDVMDFSKEDAISSLGKKAVFAPVIEYFDAVAKGENNVTFDFSVTALKEPRWFGGDDSAEDEDESEAA